MWRIQRHDGKFGFSFIASKRPFRKTIFRNILSKFQRVHIFVKSKKVGNTAQTTKIAGGIYAGKITHFLRAKPERTELAWISYLLGTVCHLHLDHSPELKFILK